MLRRPMSPLKLSVRSRSGPAAVRWTIAEPRMCPASMNRNRAVRVTSVSRPGAVLAAESVHDELGDGSGFSWSFAGARRLKGIKGDLSVNVLSGAIAISGASRIASARTLSGSVTVSDVDGDGNISVGSMSGPVTLDNVAAVLEEGRRHVEEGVPTVDLGEVT